MLEVRNISAFYGKHQALDDVSLDVGQGEIVVLLGANGAGKTTLLKVLAGLIPATAAARIAMNGLDLARTQAHEIVEAGLALVPEGRGIFGELTVQENLLLGAFPARARRNEVAALGMVLDLFPRLRERLQQVVRTMSGGEQQMVAVGRALMSSPEIILLDEPSLGLAPIMCTELFGALAHIRSTGVGILLVEQNARLSLKVGDRGYLIESGRIVGSGTAAALKDDPAVQRAYLGAGEIHVELPLSSGPTLA
jgi:branched-chain amino acid transport system ATP-binding protein